MAISYAESEYYKKKYGWDPSVDTEVSPEEAGKNIVSGVASFVDKVAPTVSAVASPIEKFLPRTSGKTISPITVSGGTEYNPKQVSGSAEYDPSLGVGASVPYTKQTRSLATSDLEKKLKSVSMTDQIIGTSSALPGQEMQYSILSQEKNKRDAEAQAIRDASDKLERKLNFQARQKELGVSALDEAASYVGTDKFTDITGVDYLNPLFYVAKAADLHVTAAKAIAQGALDATSALGASLDLNAGDNIVGEFGQAVSDYAKIVKQKYPQLNPAKNLGSWDDPEFYVRGVAGMLPNLLGGMMAAQAGAVVGAATTANPVGASAGALAGATAFGYAMESGSIYDDLLTRGYSPTSAALGSKAYGAIAALPEALFHVRGMGNAIVHPLMQEVIKKGAQAEIKQTLFTGAKNIARKSSGALIEGTTESMQQLAQNAITRFYDKNQGLFDGMAESFVFGLGSGALVDAGQSVGKNDIRKEAVIALQNEKAIEQAVKATEELAMVYPKDRDIASLVEKTKEELQNAKLQTKVVDAKFTQENTTPIVKNEVLDANVSKTVKGKFIATFDATLDGKSVTFTTAVPSLTEQDAQIEVAQKTQKWLENQVSTGQVTNIEEAKVLNTSLKEIISPKQDIVTEEVQKNIEEINKNTSETNYKIDALIAEAKKYKSAEEFANTKINEKYGMIRDRNDINIGISTSVETANNNTKRQRSAEQKTINKLAKEGKIKTIKLGDGKLSPLSENDWNIVRKNTPITYKSPVSNLDYNKIQSEYSSFIKIYNNVQKQNINSENTKTASEETTPTKDMKSANKKKEKIPKYNVSLYVKHKGDNQYRIANKDGSLAKNKLSASLIHPDDYIKFRDFISQHKNEINGAEFQIREHGTNKVYYDSSKDIQNKAENKPTKEVKSEKKVTRFAERMKEQFKELASPEEYKTYKMNEEIDKASKIIEKDEKKAYSIAMGYTESNPEEMSFTNQTMIKKAIDEGNIDLANSLITHLSKEGTKAGQLIVSLKAMSQGYSAEKYMMDVLRTRTALANKKLGSFKDTFQNIKDAISGKTNTKVQKEVKERAKKAELTIEEKRKISLEKAKKFISDLQCK